MEIKYSMIGRVILHIEQLIELLENSNKIGPSNIIRGENGQTRLKGIKEQHKNRKVSHTTQ